MPSAAIGALAILRQMTAVERTGEYARILAENRRYTDAFDRSALTAMPLSRLAVVACMDARLDVEETLGLRTGDAHIIRNAGGLVTDDVIRSLIVSVELLGTQEIVLIEHTRCGLQDLDEDAFRARVAADSGTDVEGPVVKYGGFTDLEENLRRQVAILRDHPLLGRFAIHGLVFDVSNGGLSELA
jgi:carbonic anhydrase